MSVHAPIDFQRLVSSCLISHVLLCSSSCDYQSSTHWFPNMEKQIHGVLCACSLKQIVCTRLFVHGVAAARGGAGPNNLELRLPAAARAAYCGQSGQARIAQWASRWHPSPRFCCFEQSGGGFARWASPEASPPMQQKFPLDGLCPRP